MTPYRVELGACPAFLDELKRLLRKHPELKAQVIKKLDHLALSPRSNWAADFKTPRCASRPASAQTFRLIYLLQGYDIIPLMLYAKNEHQDAVLRDVLHAISLVTRRAEGGAI